MVDFGVEKSGVMTLFQQLHYIDIFQYRKVRYYLKATFSAHISVRFRQRTRTFDCFDCSAVPLRTPRPQFSHSLPDIVVSI